MEELVPSRPLRTLCAWAEQQPAVRGAAAAGHRSGAVVWEDESKVWDATPDVLS